MTRSSERAWAAGRCMSQSVRGPGVAERFCPRCGAPARLSTGFCGRCGGRLLPVSQAPGPEDGTATGRGPWFVAAGSTSAAVDVTPTPIQRTPIVERQALEVIATFLEARGIDASEFRCRQMTILNHGVIQMGSNNTI